MKPRQISGQSAATCNRLIPPLQYLLNQIGGEAMVGLVAIKMHKQIAWRVQAGVGLKALHVVNAVQVCGIALQHVNQRFLVAQAIPVIRRGFAGSKLVGLFELWVVQSLACSRNTPELMGCCRKPLASGKPMR